ncbi:MAG: translation initiation factor IF-1 [Deltaproteobacteria bacterium CG11_big_fil_rev_8_21_14_0_20_45_16]|nr:MAG: translation initiation factor IF-1 [Deltaproteobacteria bacterium CG11_big_fil_rev_8_21_14_0_20_45_16]
MSKADLVRVEGKIIEAAGRGNYKVLLDNAISVNARLSGKMSRFKIRVTVGDRVSVDMSPYDLTHGIITHRHKT